MEDQYMSAIKNQIKASISQNSYKGFVNDRGCIIVCTEMMSIIQVSKININARRIFDVYIIVLIEAVNLFFHADGTSGTITEVIQECIKGIGNMCREADEYNQTYYFDCIIKTVQISAFQDWPDYGYKLLRYAVCLISNQKQANKIFDVFSILGKMFDGKDYPDKFVIIHGIIERMEGNASADKYLMENIHVAEIRMIAVDKLLAERKYVLAEELCVEALQITKRKYLNRPTIWAYYLEKIYSDTANKEKLIDIYYHNIFHGDMSYIKKLKDLYQNEEASISNS